MAEARHIDGNRINDYFPDDGKLRRDLYTKHLEFFEAGKDFRERCFMAGNRVGKTIAGGVEVTYHLTGRYPVWWNGRRWDRPVRCMAAGDTTQTTKDILQAKLLGDYDDMGGGLIPRETLGEHTSKSGTAKGIESIKVKHVTGGWSSLKLRSYEQGRKIFQGTEEDVIWFDEEPPNEVYNEALVRTMTTNGITIITFTPMLGMSETVMGFLPKEYQLAKN